MENGVATPFGMSVGAKIEDAALRELMPESFLNDYDRLNLPDLRGPSLQMPIHIFKFQK
jgi:hypothetical protein